MVLTYIENVVFVNFEPFLEFTEISYFKGFLMIGWGGGGGVDVISLLKGGCTRFEVENISCNLLFYIQ